MTNPKFTHNNLIIHAVGNITITILEVSTNKYSVDIEMQNVGNIYSKKVLAKDSKDVLEKAYKIAFDCIEYFKEPYNDLQNQIRKEYKRLAAK